ncbi:LA_2272 family surface repeat-containing protein [Deminuibacter soli]|uniref:Carboxypeptidase-like regulatory domain-containing protein n=1 Tax=Deminuibacter soli TaxID=2291815 RepID=A0A3E1NDY6_9BACT|nr:hypothetical protein [Deminuibacter soli]RFM26175.1 hypothetical protein DXN05_21485 [Deminuibacter soli]
MNQPALIKRLIILLCLAFPAVAGAQHLLDKKLAFFSVNKASSEEALLQLGELGNVHFSYKTDILEPGQTVSLSAENKTVSQLLRLLFKEKYEYAEHQDFIIITKRNSYYIITGQISDKETGKPLDSVMVSSSLNGLFALSNKDGIFQLKIPVGYPMGYIVLKKELYLDVFIDITKASDHELAVQMQAVKPFELMPVTTLAREAGKHGHILANPFYNTSKRSSGFEAAGIFNSNTGNAYNFQIAGAVNIVGKSLKGVQVAGLHNLVIDSTSGIQVSALVNKTEGPVNGMQIAAVNHAGKLRGVQIGLINITDSSDGYSIGLLNFVRNAGGYHSLSLFASDLMNTNLAVKLGNAKLYTVFMAGMNIVRGKRLYAAGIGLGHDILLTDKLAILTEANYQAVNAGSWDNRLLQLKSSLNLRLRKGVSFFAGPVFYHYTNGQGNTVEGYKNMQAAGYKAVRSWTGWQAGITSTNLLWSPGKQYVCADDNWSIQAGAGGGISFDVFDAAEWASVDLRVQKGIKDYDMVLMFTAGLNHRFNRSSAINDITALYTPGTTDYIAKLGLKVFVIRRFYVAAELGSTLNKVARKIYNEDKITNRRRFLWSPSIGWMVGRKWDISARIESVHTPLLLRCAYTLWKSR